MNNISVVIITQNSQRYLKQVLTQAKKVSNNVVVIDGFSTDQTPAICKATEGVNFIQNEFEGYSKQKNFGNKQAKHNWVLSLDSDEVLSDELIEEINELQLNNPHEVFNISRLNYYCTKFIKHGLWKPDRHNRLFHKTNVYWNEQETVHETLVLPKNTKTTVLNGKLEHYAYQNLNEHKAKIKTYNNLFVAQNLNNKKPALIFNILFNPGFKFFKSFFLKLGFLDGYWGFVLATMLGWETFLKYTKLWLAKQNKNNV